MQEGTSDAADRPVTEGQSSSADTATLCKQGIKSYTDGDYKSAIEMLEKALADKRDDWKALACLGLSYYHEGELARAQETFIYVVAQCPDEAIKARSTQALERV